MSEYRIGEFARKLCVSQDLLKHYEKYEIISSEKKGPGGYRYYDFRQSPRILFSKQLQNWGFSLKEISRIIRGESSAGTLKILSDKLIQLKDEHLIHFWQIRYLEYICCLIKSVEEGRFQGQWSVRDSERYLFLPHTRGYDFLPDGRGYEALQKWISLLGVSSQAAIIDNIRAEHPDLTHGFVIPFEAAEELNLTACGNLRTFGGGRSFLFNSTLADQPDIEESPFIRKLLTEPFAIADKHNFAFSDSLLVITHFLSCDTSLSRHRQLIFPMM